MIQSIFNHQTVTILLLVLSLTGVYLAIVLVGFKKFVQFSKKEESKRIRPEEAESVRKSIEADPFLLKGKPPKGL